MVDTKRTASSSTATVKRPRLGKFAKSNNAAQAARRLAGKTLKTRPRKYPRKANTSLFNVAPMSLRQHFSVPANLNRPLNVPGCIGNFVCLDAHSFAQVKTSSTYGTYLVQQWTESACKHFVIQYDDAYATTPELAMILQPVTLPQFTTEAPDKVRAMRMTTGIRNVGPADKVEGMVRVANISNPIDWIAGLGISEHRRGPFAKAELIQTLEMMTSATPDSRTFTGQELRKGHFWSSHPLFIDGLQRYKNYSGPPSLPTDHNPASDTAESKADRAAFSTHCVQLLAAGAGQAPLSTIIYYFPPTAAPQNYDIALWAQDAAVYSANSLGSLLAKAPSTAAAAWTQHTNKLKGTGSQGHTADPWSGIG